MQRKLKSKFFLFFLCFDIKALIWFRDWFFVAFHKNETAAFNEAKAILFREFLPQFFKISCHDLMLTGSTPPFAVKIFVNLQKLTVSNLSTQIRCLCTACLKKYNFFFPPWFKKRNYNDLFSVGLSM